MDVILQTVQEAVTVVTAGLVQVLAGEQSEDGKHELVSYLERHLATSSASTPSTHFLMLWLSPSR